MHTYIDTCVDIHLDGLLMNFALVKSKHLDALIPHDTHFLTVTSFNFFLKKCH